MPNEVIKKAMKKKMKNEEAAMKPMKVMKMKAVKKPCPCPPPKREAPNHSIIDHLKDTMMWDWVDAEIAKDPKAYERLCDVDKGLFVQTLVDIYGELNCLVDSRDEPCTKDDAEEPCTMKMMKKKAAMWP